MQVYVTHVPCKSANPPACKVLQSSLRVAGKPLACSRPHHFRGCPPSAAAVTNSVASASQLSRATSTLAPATHTHAPHPGPHSVLARAGARAPQAWPRRRARFRHRRRHNGQYARNQQAPPSSWRAPHRPPPRLAQHRRDGSLLSLPRRAVPVRLCLPRRWRRPPRRARRRRWSASSATPTRSGAPRAGRPRSC
jgi:hypothetical protein